MNSPHPNRGPWIHRLTVTVLTFLVALLFYWLLGFVLSDIGSMRGPQWAEVEEARVDAGLRQQEEALQRQVEQIQFAIRASTNRQAVLRDSTDNSERTMNRLLEFQKLSLQKDVTPSELEQNALAESQELFLQRQRQYQEINDRIAELSEELRALEAAQRENSRLLQEARRPAREEHARLAARHQLRLGFYQLAVLVPLLIVLVGVILKRRTSLYTPLLFAAGVATALRVMLVMHEHFPRKYFKYILILTALTLAVVALVYLLRMVAFPKPGWLLKQRREAYERFLCPVCAFPIRRGPLRYSFWNRRTAKRLLPGADAARSPEEPYVCPVCASSLFEECPACHGIRASLLPACNHCGAVITNASQKS